MGENSVGWISTFRSACATNFTCSKSVLREFIPVLFFQPCLKLLQRQLALFPFISFLPGLPAPIIECFRSNAAYLNPCETPLIFLTIYLKDWIILLLDCPLLEGARLPTDFWSRAVISVAALGFAIWMTALSFVCRPSSSEAIAEANVFRSFKDSLSKSSRAPNSS